MLLCSSNILQTPDYAAVYVLECEAARWYVGFSRRPRLRIEQHFLGEGASFTKEYRPIRVYELRSALDERDEFELWKHYARQYGWQRVGGYTPFVCERCGFEWPFYQLVKRRKRYHFTY